MTFDFISDMNTFTNPSYKYSGLIFFFFVKVEVLLIIVNYNVINYFTYSTGNKFYVYRLMNFYMSMYLKHTQI